MKSAPKILLGATLNPKSRLLLPALLQCHVSKGTTISDGPAKMVFCHYRYVKI